jgi:HD-like signal output (HDOD) protein
MKECGRAPCARVRAEPGGPGRRPSDANARTPTMPISSKSPLNLRVPTLPPVVEELTRLIEDPRSGVGDVAHRISIDAPLAGKVLQLANSSAYGLRERCNSIERAAAVLGMRTLRSVVVHACVFQEYERLSQGSFDLDALWRHSGRTAQVCSLLAKSSSAPGAPGPDDAYVCGLLHDVGQVVLLDNFGERYVAAHAKAKRERLSLPIAELTELGVQHAEVGGRVLKSWGFSSVLQAAVRLHHAQSELESLPPAVVLLVKANAIVELFEAGGFDGLSEVLDPAIQRLLGLKPDAAETISRHLEQSGAPKSR